jgi:hypothetical protein
VPTQLAMPLLLWCSAQVHPHFPKGIVGCMCLHTRQQMV